MCRDFCLGHLCRPHGLMAPKELLQRPWIRICHVSIKKQFSYGKKHMCYRKWKMLFRGAVGNLILKAVNCMEAPSENRIYGILRTFPNPDKWTQEDTNTFPKKRSIGPLGLPRDCHLIPLSRFSGNPETLDIREGVPFGIQRSLGHAEICNEAKDNSDPFTWKTRIALR